MANEKDDRERRALGLGPRNPPPNKKHSVKKVYQPALNSSYKKTEEFGDSSMNIAVRT